MDRPTGLRLAGRIGAYNRTLNWHSPEIIVLALYRLGLGANEIARFTGHSTANIAHGLETLGVRRSKRAYLDSKIAQGAKTNARWDALVQAERVIGVAKAKLRLLARRMRAARRWAWCLYRGPSKRKHYLRTRLWKNVRYGCPDADAIARYGCTIAHLRAHIGSRWQPEMTWSNHSMHGWHIDHIKPCASYNLYDEAQTAACFHYTNLQPLWATQNRRKSAKHRA